MIGKEQTDLLDQYAHTIVGYVQNQQKMVDLKTQTIKKLNEVTQVHFEKNLEKIGKIKEEFQQTHAIQQKLDEYVQQINDISKSIEGMETSVEYLDTVLKRIETKLTEIEKIKV